MLYDFSKLNQKKLLMQKNFNTSKNILLTFLVLTNNLNLYFAFFNFYKAFLPHFFNKTYFKIKKNNFFFLKIYSRFRNFFTIHKYIFKLFLKNNKFLSFNLRLKNTKLKSLFFKNFTTKKYLTFLHYKNNFFKN
jgi:hypothetical protein